MGAEHRGALLPGSSKGTETMKLTIGQKVILATLGPMLFWPHWY